jgi:predicted lipid-binding transport protein (Tim44 family)
MVAPAPRAKVLLGFAGLGCKRAYIAPRDGSRAPGVPSNCGPIAGMSGFFDVYSIIFLVIAVVIFMRLGSVLGRRTGNEPSPFDQRVKTPQAGARNDNVVALPPRDRTPAPSAAPDLEPLARHAAPGTPLHDGLVAIAKADPSFDPEHFLSGAKVAYEMVVTAFAEGDRATLKNLLSPEVYDGFLSAIADRERRQNRSELTFVGMEEARITAAEFAGRTARVSVRFVAELISVTRDKGGSVVEGDATEVQTIRDAWTFARDVESRDPNWKLVATEAV